MNYTWRSVWLVALIASVLIGTTQCYTITVDAHAEECFFENVEAETKMGKFLLIQEHFI